MSDFDHYDTTLAYQSACKAHPHPPSRLNLDWRYITTTHQLEAEIDPYRTRKILGIDTETTGLDPHQDQVRLVQIATAGMPTLVIDLWKVGEIHALKTLLAHL
jgi:DNA polymerase I